MKRRKPLTFGQRLMWACLLWGMTLFALAAAVSA